MRLLVLVCSLFHRRACPLGSQTTNRFFNYSRDIPLAQTNPPIAIGSRTVSTNGPLTYFKNRSIVPLSPQNGSLPQSPDPVTNFLAQLGNGAFGGVGQHVPDTYGAVGTNFVVTMLNTGVRYQTRTGVTLKTNTLADFWTSTNISAFTTISDPRIVYDPFENRWIATAMTDFVTTNSSILIGASLTSNPTNGWNLRQVKADTNNLYWADYPTLGFNKEWVVVQANMLWLTNVLPLRSHIYVFNKSNLYSGGFTPPTLLLHTNADAAGNEAP